METYVSIFLRYAPNSTRHPNRQQRAFLDEMDESDRAVFKEGFKLVNRVQREEWKKSVAEAKNKAENEMGVHFSYPDTKPCGSRI